MAASETLPEGTDSIVPGASVIDMGDDVDPLALESASGATTAAPSEEAFQQPTISDRVQGLKGQAGDKARDYATQGRDKAAEALENIVRMIEDAASQIDDKIGAQYGDYARQGAQSLAGLSSSLQQKDVDELFEDARGLVRRSPGVAIATAATIGFMLARIARAGIDTSSTGSDQAGRSAGSGGGAA